MGGKKSSADDEWTLVDTIESRIDGIEFIE